MNRHKAVIFLILTTLFLASCSAPPQPPATSPTPLPTKPSADTFTPQPSRTPIPTQNSTAVADGDPLSHALCDADPYS